MIVDILGHKWEFAFEDDGRVTADQMWGVTYTHKERVLIDSTASKSRQRATVLHELFHAISAHVLTPGAALTEEQLTPLTAALDYVFSHNPELMELLGSDGAS